jgi:tetratricopeptide (TPR) repeat protein
MDLQHISEPGQCIANRYVVEGVLGRGGMATVYKVRDTHTGTSVALKRGSTRDPSKSAKRQVLLQREYHTLEQLRHPRIIEVYDYGVDDAGPYYTMEWLDGADLDSSGPLPWQEACAVLRDVASSLAILHSRGLLHRDVSPRNVRRTRDGRAKLIDFGAMTSTGISVEVSGTPPFIAPEVLQIQPLDSRADLFSLGALAYFLVSGRHAYPARSVAELRDLWRSRPVPLTRLLPDIPPALDALVLELLALDRSARPEHAAEVMSRLCAIASLPSDEHDAVSLAYLKTPRLVGRDAALVVIRKRMLALARGDGGSLYIEGVAGSGRSRMLDAVAVEAKLAGAIVARADARDATSGQFGVARALIDQFCKLMPEQAAKAARLLPTVERFSAPPAAPRRSAFPPGVRDETLELREIRNFILALSRSHRLVITVDDAERVDEQTAALLATLGDRAERNPLLVVFSLDRDGKALRSPPLRMLCASSTQVELDELSPVQTEALIRSVFGDVAHLPLVTGRIHALSHGNPQAAMAFAQHLVDSGLARYQAGRWSLPAYIGENDLPATLSASLSLRVATLGPDARELCEALALAEGDGIALPDYVTLTSHGDESRTLTALNELVVARVLVAGSKRYSFARRAYVGVLLDEMPAARAQPVHSRLADWLAVNGGTLVRQIHHLFEGGRELEAIALLRTIGPRTPLPPLALLERAVEYAERHGADARSVLKLRTAIVGKASLQLARESFWRHAPILLAQIEQDCGLARYRELGHVAPSERLRQALGDAQRRYEQTPPEARGYNLIEALQELARVVTAFCAMGMGELDIEPIERLPAIDALVPLSPAIELVRKRIESARAWVHGQVARCLELQQEMIARLTQPDHCGLDEARYAEVLLALNYGIGAIEAAMGSAHVEQRAQLLETQPHTRIIAWVLRHILALNQGNTEEARRCLRRAEVYRLQLGLETAPPTLGAGSQLLAHARLGNLLGVKSAVDDLTVLAGAHPGWRPVLLLGLSHKCRLQGDLEGALSAIEEAVAIVRSGGHLYFSRIAGVHVDLLTALGRDEQAANCARQYLELWDPNELGTGDADLYSPAALALARGGEPRRGAQLLDNAIAYSQRVSRTGIPLGLLSYARARIAIAMSDRPAFEHFADLCAQEFKRSKNLTIIAKFERLLEEASQCAMAPDVQPSSVRELLDLARSQSEYVTLQSRMDECFDTGDRARCALTLLLEHVEGLAGCLYGVYEDGRVKLLAALPEDMSDQHIDAWVDAYVSAECMPPEFRPVDVQEAPKRQHTDEQGRVLEAVGLYGVKDGSEHMAAVFVHHTTPESRTPDRMLLSTLAATLLNRGDVSGAKLDSVVTA